MMNNRNALILGATGGIGEAICHELRMEKYHCYLIGRSSEKLTRLRKKHLFSSDQTFCIDSITSTDGFKKTQAWLGQLRQEFSVAIHCAGLGVMKRASEIRLEDWQALMDINLNSAFAFFKLAWDFRSANRFELVYFGSASVDQAWPKNSLYGASKAGLEVFAKSLQKEIRPDGGRVWLYKPGSVRTGFFDQLPNHLPKVKMLDPNIVAKIVVENLQRDQTFYLPEIQILSE